MAYQQKNLSALSYANGFTLWHYRTPDSGGYVLSAGYFNDGVRMLRVGDFIFVNAGLVLQNVTHAVPCAPTQFHGLLVVAENTGNTVVVAAMAHVEHSL